MLAQLRYLGERVLKGALWLLYVFYLSVGLLLAIYFLGVGLRWAIYAAYRLGFFSWFFGGALVQSILGAITLLAAYGLIYYWLRIRKRRFIVVSEFRVWGALTAQFNDKGLVARLRDELMRLGAEMRAADSGQPPETASVVAALSTQRISEAKPILWEGGGLLLPGTYVTLQYEGISLEAMHTFIRRFTGREAVITGDLLNVPDGLVLVARTDDDGPWEVLIKSSDLLGIGLRRLALRIFTTFAQKFLKEVNTFVFLQRKAIELEEYNLLIRLADLEVEAAVSDEQKNVANENLAKAYNSSGIFLGDQERYDEALREFDRAIELSPNFEDAIENRRKVLEIVNSPNESDLIES